VMRTFRPSAVIILTARLLQVTVAHSVVSFVNKSLYRAV
jgi:hypothetical protein